MVIVNVFFSIELSSIRTDIHGQNENFLDRLSFWSIDELFKIENQVHRMLHSISDFATFGKTQNNIFRWWDVNDNFPPSFQLPKETFYNILVGP